MRINYNQNNNNNSLSSHHDLVEHINFLVFLKNIAPTNKCFFICNLKTGVKMISFIFLYLSLLDIFFSYYFDMHFFLLIGYLFQDLLAITYTILLIYANWKDKFIYAYWGNSLAQYYNYIFAIRLLTYPFTDLKHNKYDFEGNMIFVYYIWAILFELLFVYFNYIIYSFTMDLGKKDNYINNKDFQMINNSISNSNNITNNSTNGEIKVETLDFEDNKLDV